MQFELLFSSSSSSIAGATCGGSCCSNATELELRHKAAGKFEQLLHHHTSSLRGILETTASQFQSECSTQIYTTIHIHIHIYIYESMNRIRNECSKWQMESDKAKKLGKWQTLLCKSVSLRQSESSRLLRL